MGKLMERYERTPADRARDRAIRKMRKMRKMRKERLRAPRRLTPMEHEVRRLRTLVSPAELRDLRAHYQERLAG